MTNLKGFKLYMLDVHVDAVKVTTVYVSDYDGVRINKLHNRLWWTRGSERQAAHAQLKLTQVDPPPRKVAAD